MFNDETRKSMLGVARPLADMNDDIEKLQKLSSALDLKHDEPVSINIVVDVSRTCTWSIYIGSSHYPLKSGSQETLFALRQGLIAGVNAAITRLTCRVDVLLHDTFGVDVGDSRTPRMVNTDRNKQETRELSNIERNKQTDGVGTT